MAIASKRVELLFWNSCRSELGSRNYIAVNQGTTWSYCFFEIIPRSYMNFAQVCLLFAIALGVAALLEGKKEKK